MREREQVAHPRSQTVLRFIGSKGSVRANSAATLIYKVINLALGLFSTVLLARWLGPSGQGLYATALFAWTVAISVLGFGVHWVNSAYTGRRDFTPEQMLSNSALLLLCGTILSLVLLLGTTIVQSANIVGLPVDYIRLILALTPVGICVDAIGGLLWGLNRVQFWAGISMVVSAAISLVAVVLLVGLMRLGVFGALVAWFSGQLVVLVVAARSLLPTIGLRFNLAPTLFRESIWFGFRSNVTNLVGTLNFRFDIFLVLNILGASQAGRYAIVVAVLQLLFFIPNSMAIALRPVLASATHERAVELTARSIRLSVATSAVGSLFLGLLAPLILQVFGPPYSSALPALLWSLPGIALYSSAFSTTVYWDSHARMPQVNLLIAAVSLVLDVIGCVFLLPRLGLAGAGIAASIGYLVAVTVSLWIFTRHAGITPRKALILRRDDFRSFSSSFLPHAPDGIEVSAPS